MGAGFRPDSDRVTEYDVESCQQRGESPIDQVLIPPDIAILRDIKDRGKSLYSDLGRRSFAGELTDEEREQLAKLENQFINSTTMLL